MSLGEYSVKTGGTGYDWEYLYTARRLDAQLNLYHYRMRYYHPELGRFINRDPLGYADGLNLCSYVANNPIVFADFGGTGKAKAVGWVVRRVGGRLIKVSVVYTEREAAKLFLRKGADIMVRGEMVRRLLY